MIRHTVVDELKYTDQKINGIVLTGYVNPYNKWAFASKDSDGSICVSYISRLLEVYNTIYPKGHMSTPKFIPFPNNMNLAEFRKCHLHKLFIRDFIKKHTGEDI